MKCLSPLLITLIICNQAVLQLLACPWPKPFVISESWMKICILNLAQNTRSRQQSMETGRKTVLLFPATCVHSDVRINNPENQKLISLLPYKAICSVFLSQESILYTLKKIGNFVISRIYECDQHFCLLPPTQ